MQKPRTVAFALSLLALSACPGPTRPETTAPTTDGPAGAAAGETQGDAAPADDFKVLAEQFADVRILRYRVPGFEALPLQQKQLVYYLYRAALAGRDIIWDQNYRHNLLVRRTLEAVVGNEASHALPGYAALLDYTKRVWFSNGIHHHYSMKKLTPGFDAEQLAAMVKAVDPGKLPLRSGQSIDQLLATLAPVVFDPSVAPKRVNLDPKQDLIKSSATNYYDGVSQKDVERFYARKVDKKDPTPVSWGLNSQLAKRRGKVVERTWKVGGMYDAAISDIVKWLELAVGVAENDKQKLALQKLIEFYRTGDLKRFDEYSIAWVADTESRVDVVNGFIEVYGDPLGYRGAWESVVSIKDMEASKRIAAIGAQAQWFEDHSPIAKNHRKPSVTGISAKVILAVVEAGDSAPSTPIGINLPNANWVRAEHGSKSVNLGNIVYAYDASKRQSGVLEEFAASKEEVARAKAHADLADALHTDMHEVIGHASGQLEPDVAQPNETLKNYSNTLEEARADLVALYYMPDPKLVEIGVAKTTDVGKAAYDNYIRNGLMVQLARLEEGEDLEEAHMRNRQMVAAWVFEKGKADKVVERVERDGKSYFVIRDYAKLRDLFGQLLAEVQRIKSTGDYEAGKALVETYGVKVDRELHAQVRKRYAALGIAPYAGFIQPRLVPVMDGETIKDVRIEYPEDFTQQMLEYAKDASLLPTEN
ncbi:MAG: dihydrofolate reductase [Deltaproteobacteria bacterium]|nr:dihydrofolate reductase [Deltaproteobacteria bacterium]MBK8714794.1 dihydrofolate reductase [Deltaproteobacteria bacterium]MBP7289529.1 dihydrofolate reductase [Nannocystaceae bacterium]